MANKREVAKKALRCRRIKDVHVTLRFCVAIMALALSSAPLEAQRKPAMPLTAVTEPIPSAWVALPKFVADGQYLPPATQRVLLKALRAEDVRGYDRVRDSIVLAEALDDSAIAEQFRRFESRRDS